MADTGLGRSRWATGPTNGTFQRVGNPKCHSCGLSNFSDSDLCFRCAHNPKPLNNGGAATNGNILGSRTNGVSAAPSWPKQRTLPKPPGTVNGSDSHTEAGGIKRDHGLSTSMWAPRNYHGNTKVADKGQVWTRTIHNPTQSTNPSSTATTLPDLGLPYQVQHYILAMIQRILEEGCFDFAMRWIPEALHTNHWDCPEAVELSKWRDFLPTALPPNAIKQLSNYTLDNALHHAVQIRNKAVHRHLCDNHEIRRMALQAQDMMSMFSDGTRSEKFTKLWVELGEWDRRNKIDPQGARQKLEEALKNISERPVDDMDWSPNIESLQEVTNKVEAVQEFVADEMELD